MHIHEPAQQITDPKAAIEILKEGNERYLNGHLLNKDTYSADREVTEGGQKPFAVVLTCSDSRVSPEIFFDQRLGDIFVVRNAGNVADPVTLGSIEYAVEHLHSPLIVVVGHSCCGAVTAAFEGGELPPNIKTIANYISPACAKGGSLDDVIHCHVSEMVKKIKEDDTIKHMKAEVVGAYYDLHTGEVIWL